MLAMAMLGTLYGAEIVGGALVWATHAVAAAQMGFILIAGGLAMISFFCWGLCD